MSGVTRYPDAANPEKEQDMATSLARRIRRIGILPKQSVAQVVDANQLDKLKNAAAKGDTKLEEEIVESIGAELQPHRFLPLTPEQIAAETIKLVAEAKARRIARRKTRKA